MRVSIGLYVTFIGIAAVLMPFVSVEKTLPLYGILLAGAAISAVMFIVAALMSGTELWKAVALLAVIGAGVFAFLFLTVWYTAYIFPKTFRLNM